MSAAPPRLRKRREEVGSTLGERITKGGELRAAPTYDEASYEDVLRSFSTWDDWNDTFLLAAFSSDAIADEYSDSTGSERIVAELEDAVANLQDRLDRRLTRLELISGRLEFFEEALPDGTSRPQPRPARDPTAALNVFVLMPFDAEHDWLYQVVKEACSATGANAVRADDVFAAGIVIEQVKERIAQADAVIAVCTGKNANVFYELGIAEATHQPILVAESKDDLSFDVAHFRAQLYGGNESANSRETLQDRIERAVTETIRSRGPADIEGVLPAKTLEETDVVATIVSTGRRHSCRLVITSSGPGAARNVSADLRSVERPDAQVMVHTKEFPFPQLIVGQDYVVALAPTNESSQTLRSLHRTTRSVGATRSRPFSSDQIRSNAFRRISEATLVAERFMPLDTAGEVERSSAQLTRRL